MVRISDRYERLNNIAPIRHQHPKGLCYIKGNVIFLPIPKNASTSIRSISDFTDRKSNIMAFKSQIEGGDYQAFAIVRDPISRFISGYIEVCKRASIDSSHILNKEFYWMDGKERLLRFIEELADGWFDAHLYPQCYFLTDYEGMCFPVRAIIDVDSIGSALPKLLADFGLAAPAIIPKLNADPERGPQFKMASLMENIDIRKRMYFIADYCIMKLQRRNIPSATEVRYYLQSDRTISKRIEDLLCEDFVFLEMLKQKSSCDEFGIHWFK